MDITNKVQAITGGYVSLTDPDPETINIDDISASLSKMCRFNGHTAEFYSVAQHCVLASYLVPDEYAMHALLHDASEAYLGDIVSPVKHLISGFEELEIGLIAAISEKFNIKNDENSYTWVKKADLIMLSTEREYLMPIDDVTWPAIKYIPPVNTRIFDCWGLEKAFFEFNHRFSILNAGYTDNTKRIPHDMIEDFKAYRDRLLNV